MLAAKQAKKNNLKWHETETKITENYRGETEILKLKSNGMDSDMISVTVLSLSDHHPRPQEILPPVLHALISVDDMHLSYLTVNYTFFSEYL